MVRTIKNPHSDAISWIEPIARAQMNGWQVWTGSYDKTINILFVPFVRIVTLECGSAEI